MFAYNLRRAVTFLSRFSGQLQDALGMVLGAKNFWREGKNCYICILEPQRIVRAA